MRQIITLLLTVTATTTFLFNQPEPVKAVTYHKQVAEQTLQPLNFSENNTYDLLSDNFLKPKTVPIKIIYHDKEYFFDVPYDSVGNTLDRVGIKLGEHDVIPFDLDEYIFPNQTINIVKIEKKERQEKQIVPFQTEFLSSDEMLKGEKKVIVQGKNGLKNVTYKEHYFNDKLWRTYVSSEDFITPAQNEIVEIGTQDIIEFPIEDLNNEKPILLKSKNDDNNFTLPKVTLSEKDKDLLERLLTGEFGSSFTGAALVAQAIKCAIVYDKYTSIENLIVGMGYVGSTNIGKTQNAVEAAKFIFDENGLAVKHRLFYMCTEDYYNSAPGNFHSTQNFILQYENVKFFDRW